MTASIPSSDFMLIQSQSLLDNPNKHPEWALNVQYLDLSMVTPQCDKIWLNQDKMWKKVDLDWPLELI